MMVPMSRVLFITGSSGSGKTTVAAQVAEHWPSTCALLDFDKIRTFIKSGYAEPAHGWDKKTEKQWTIARDVVASMTQAYAPHNIDVVIEAFATPGDYSAWKKSFGNILHETFVLLPPLDRVLARNNERDGTAKLKEADIRQNYEWYEGWKNVDGVVVLKNSTDSPKQTADKIISLVI